MQLCEYGCGQKAEHQLKNGKWCCSKSYNSCPFQRNKRSIQMEEKWKDPDNILNSTLCREKMSNSMKKLRRDPNSVFNSNLFKIKHSNTMKNLRKDPNSKYNSNSYKERVSVASKEAWANPKSKLNSIEYKENQINIMKELWADSDGIFNSIEYRKKRSSIMKEIRNNPDNIYNSILCKEKHSFGLKKAWKELDNRFNLYKLTIENINKKYPFFSEIEEMRYNPDKPGEEEIQVRCKNHECENSKEKDGWFTPTSYQLQIRKNMLENEGEDKSYFYCCQYCKDTCVLFGLRNDPFKNTTKPYTYQENQLWRQIVLELDKGLCQFCGNPATDVHHIKPVKTHPHLALDPDNGISFCEECHYKIGHKTGSECSTGNLANKQGCVLGGQ